MGLELTWRLEEFRAIVNEYFPVTDLWFDGGRPAFVVQVPPDSQERFLQLRRRLLPLGYLPLLRRRDGPGDRAAAGAELAERVLPYWRKVRADWYLARLKEWAAERDIAFPEV